MGWYGGGSERSLGMNGLVCAPDKLRSNISRFEGPGDPDAEDEAIGFRCLVYLTRGSESSSSTESRQVFAVLDER